MEPLLDILSEILGHNNLGEAFISYRVKGGVNALPSSGERTALQHPH